MQSTQYFLFPHLYFVLISRCNSVNASKLVAAHSVKQYRCTINCSKIVSHLNTSSFLGCCKCGLKVLYIYANHFISNAAFHLKAIFSASEKYRIIEEYGIDSYTLYSNEKLLFQHDFASYENMRNWVFSFGDKVEILEPKELYCDRLQQAKNIISQEMGKEK